MLRATNNASQIRGAFLIDSRHAWTVVMDIGVVKVPLAIRNFLIGSMIAVSGSGLIAAARAADVDRPIVMVQANIPPTGMGDKDMAMAAANMAAEERMNRRYPQPIRVGALVGARVGDNDSRTLGFVRQVVRTPQGKIDLIVDYGGWFGWGTRPVAVAIAVVGSLGREVVSLDMQRTDYASAPTWQSMGDTVLPNDNAVRIALARR
jgi:hypothetical protein